MARTKKPTAPVIPALPDDISDKELTDLIHEMRIDASGPSELTSEDVDVWVKASGWTPVEFLTHAYRNPFQKMEYRISAAKAVLEYAHRKLPQKIQVEQSGEVGVRTLDAAALAKLSGDELSVLEKILEKMGGEVSTPAQDVKTSQVILDAPGGHKGVRPRSKSAPKSG